MRTLTVRNLSAPQIAAFAELFPVLSDAGTIAGTPLVTAKGTTAIVVKLHPQVFGNTELAAFEAGPRLARAAAVLSASCPQVKTATVQALVTKLAHATPDPA